MNKIQNSSVEHANLQQIIRQLEQKNENLEAKLDFLSTILSSKPDLPESYERFHELLWQEFMAFANSESSLSDEAAVVLKLQQIDEKLKEIINFKHLYNKTIIAVGGGFSAGKSEFLSSFFLDTQIKLPIGIKPTTAIPIYITHCDSNNITGFNNKGGTFNIKEDIFMKLSHDYIKSFSFNIRELLPLITVQTPLKRYKNIAFVDTPGYNPSSYAEGFTSEDIDISAQYMEKADALIWLIGLDSTGTILTSDIDFLEELIEKFSYKTMSLYIVANKADLRSEEDLEDILDEIEEQLEDNDIPYKGICAFSSINAKEYIYRGMSLFDYLNLCDNPVDTKLELIESLDSIFDKYQDAILKNIDTADEIKNMLKSLELDILEKQFENYDERIANKISELKQRFNVDLLKKQLNKLAELREQIVVAVENIFQEIATKKLLKSYHFDKLDKLVVDKKREEILTDALNDPWTCDLAASLFLEIGGSNKLFDILENENSLARRAAAKVLARKGGKQSTEVLIKALEDDDKYVRKIAIKGLKDLKDVRVVEGLIKMTNELGTFAYLEEIAPDPNVVHSIIDEISQGKKRRPVLVFTADGAMAPIRTKKGKPQCWKENKGVRVYLLDDDHIVHLLTWHQICDKNNLLNIYKLLKT